MILTNPVLLGVVTMVGLCLVRFNVLLSILVSAMVAGVCSGKGFVQSLNLLITGMQGNLETALNYLLLGAIAACIANTNLTTILVNKASKYVSKKRYIFVLFIAIISCFSQNLIPIHIAFIPVLIPPLLGIMNSMKLDRRAVACALTFGLQAPYVGIGVGFGLLFYTLLQKEFLNNGLKISIYDIQSVMYLGFVAMFVGLILAMFFYRKDRIYKTDENFKTQNENLKMAKKEWIVLLGIVFAFFVQIFSNSLALGAFLGLIFIIVFGGVEYKKVDFIMDSSLKMMGFIAFVMLVAAGFGNVLRQSGGIENLVGFVANFADTKILGATLMLIIGLFITIGIGTSFGTIPIIASIYIPLCQKLGFSLEGTILLVGIAAALGDAGSPASDSTLGPTSGLNADGNHNHIYDTCVPTFIFFNIPLIIFGVIFSTIL